MPDAIVPPLSPPTIRTTERARRMRAAAPKRERTSSLSRMLVLKSLFSCSRRAATFTVSPMTAYFIRVLDPRLPATTTPELAVRLLVVSSALWSSEDNRLRGAGELLWLLLLKWIHSP